MSVKLTQEAENERTKSLQDQRSKKGTWDFYRTTSLVEAVHYARKAGWGKKKVQVRAFHTRDNEFEYFVEPYEDSCNCPNLLRYEDYFD